MNLRDRIKQTQRELGITPKKSLGQNFLISESVVGKIVDELRTFSPKQVIEVGPGLGSLTHSLKETGVDMLVIELDRVFAEYWRGHGMNVVEADALDYDWSRLNPLRPCVLVSNLPYQISSRIVIDRSIDQEPLDGMILMFQKEVAQRMHAKAGSEHYGFLSVVVQTFWKTNIVSEAGPRDFDPPPNVASRVLAFRPVANLKINRARYLEFLKAGFLHPRKLLASNLLSLQGIERDLVEKLLEERSFGPKARAEELGVQDLLHLAGILGYT